LIFRGIRQDFRRSHHKDSDTPKSNLTERNPGARDLFVNIFLAKLCLSHSYSSISDDIEFDTFTLREGDPRLFTFANNHDVLQTSSKMMTLLISQVDNFEGSRVLFETTDNTDSTHVVTTHDHSDVSVLEGGKILDFSSRDVNSDGVISLDLRMRKSDGTPVVGNQVSNSLCSLSNVLNTAQLVSCFCRGNLVDAETTLGIVEKSEVFLGLLNRDNILESRRKGMIGSDLSIDLDESLDGNGLSLLNVKAYFNLLRNNTIRGKHSRCL